MNKLRYIFLGILLGLPTLALAVNVSIPQSTGYGQIPIGNAIGGSYTPTATSSTNFFTVTTSGTSGAATYTSGTLNIPQYAGALFPFTPTSYGNATSTTLGFLNGFTSPASSTIAGTFHLSLSAGGLGIDSNGLVYSGATSTLSTISGTLGVAKGGTGATSFLQGWLGINDSGAFISSTSPTVAWLTATSTATSTFNGGVNLNGTDCFAISGTCLQTYIQNATAYKQAANYATAAVLPGTPSYANGSSGVGATLTEVGFGALVVDGQTVTLGQRILVKNQADLTQNGIYTVTTVGSGIASYLLTRATDYNTTNDIYAGTTVPVLVGGTANGDTQWTESTTGTITVGSSNIAFLETSFGTNGTITSVTATYPLASSGGATPNITTSFGTTTNNGMAAGNLYVGSGGIWQTAASTSIFGYLPLNPTRQILTTFPLAGGGDLSADRTLTFGGLSTSSAIAAGAAVLYATGVNTVASAATGTITGSTGLSVTAGQSIIGSGLTITNTGVTSIVAGNGMTISGATGAVTINQTSYVATSTGETQGQLSYWTTTNGTPAKLGSVATGTVSGASVISATAGQSVIGSGLTITTTPGTFGGATAYTFPQDLVITNNATSAIAAFTTLASTTKLTISNSPACSGSSALTTNAAGLVACGAITASAGAYPFTPTSAFGVTTSATTSSIWDKVSFFASTTGATPSWLDQLNIGSTTQSKNIATSTFAGSVNITGNASTSQFVVSNVPNALVLTSSGGVLGAYGGASACSANNWITTISAVGASTCGTIGANGLTLSMFPTIAANTVIGNLTGATATPTAFATSSLFTFSPSFYNTAGVTGSVFYQSFTYATSTAWTGTTTIPLEAAFGETWTSAQCFTDVGTVNVDLYEGSPSSANKHLQFFNASTTIGTVTFSSFLMTAGTTTRVDIGTPASSPTKLTCTIKKSL